MDQLSQAIATATRTHAGQIGKADEPFVLHPLRVMLHQDDDVRRAIAVLHDVVEKTDTTLEDLRAEGFTDDVLRGVDAMTRRPGEDYFDFCRRAAAEPLARPVKLADLDDNIAMVERAGGDPEDIERWRRARDIVRGSES